MTEDIFDKVKQELLPPDDERMLKIALSASPAQEELDDFLSTWDIEKAGSHRALMLSYCMKAHPELEFPAYTGPRLGRSAEILSVPEPQADVGVSQDWLCAGSRRD